MDSGLLLLGLGGAVLITALSASNYRVAIKVALVLVLYEGALRKWAIPGAADLIYFVKDFILLGAYYKFYTEQRSSLHAQWPALPIPLIVGCVFVLSANIANLNTGSVLASLLGLRGYIFYLPLTVIIPRLFHSVDDLKWNIACYLLISIPIGLLGVAQFQSDAFSVVNTYASGTDESYGVSTFGDAENKVRITGTFSYLSGHVVFVITFFALNLAALCVPKMPFRAILTFVSLPLLVAGAFMSGARAAILTQLFIAVCFTIGAGLSNSRKIRNSLGVILLAGVGLGVTIPFFFGEAASKSFGRLFEASDSVMNRTVDQPIEQVLIAFDRGGVVGCGLGTTSSVVASLRNKMNLPRPDYEPGAYDLEMAQTMAEGGVVGFLAWYFLRFAVGVALWRSYMNCSEPTLKMLALAALVTYIPFTLISLVLNHVACVLVWSLVGLGFSATWHLQNEHAMRLLRPNFGPRQDKDLENATT